MEYHKKNEQILKPNSIENWSDFQFDPKILMIPKVVLRKWVKISVSRNSPIRKFKKLKAETTNLSSFVVKSSEIPPSCNLKRLERSSDTENVDLKTDYLKNRAKMDLQESVNSSNHLDFDRDELSLCQ